MDISEESLNRSGCSLPDQTRPKLNTSRERSIQADLTEHRSFKDTGVGSNTEMGLWSTPRKLDGLQLPVMSPIGPERMRPRGSDSSTPDRARRRRPRQKDSSGLEGKNIGKSDSELDYSKSDFYRPSHKRWNVNSEKFERTFFIYRDSICTFSV